MCNVNVHEIYCTSDLSKMLNIKEVRLAGEITMIWKSNKLDDDFQLKEYLMIQVERNCRCGRLSKTWAELKPDLRTQNSIKETRKDTRNKQEQAILEKMHQTRINIVIWT